MNDSFEQYTKRNTPGPDKVGQSSGSAMEAIQNANWLPWPRKDLAKGGKGGGKSHSRQNRQMAKTFRKKKA